MTPEACPCWVANTEVRVLRQSPAAEDVLVRVQAADVSRNSVSVIYEREVAALTPTDVGATGY